MGRRHPRPQAPVFGRGMTRLFDADGDEVERTRDGDLRAVAVPLPAFDPERPCDDHGDLGIAHRADRCIACWSEIKAGDRPRTFLGRRFPAEPAEVSS